MTYPHKKAGPPRRQEAGQRDPDTTTLTPNHIASDQAAVPLLAATIVAPAARVAQVLAILPPEVVELLDQPVARLLDVAGDLANAGTAPTATLVGAEALRRGLYAGHAGDLTRTRLADAVTTIVAPEVLPRLAADLAAELFRSRLAAAGHALVTYACTGAEVDAWDGFVRDGRELRRLHDNVLVPLREMAGQVGAA